METKGVVTRERGESKEAKHDDEDSDDEHGAYK